MSQIDLPGVAACDNSVLKTGLADFQKNLNCGHVNVQSFGINDRSGKFNELKTILKGNYLDVVGISETWAKSYQSDKSLEIGNYRLFRNDRPKIRGGGVALYVSRKIKAKTVELSNYSASTPLEFLLVEARIGTNKVLLGVFYCPNRNGGSLSDVNDVLLKYTGRYDKIIIMGDFNNNLLDSAINDRNTDTFNSSNLEIIHNNMPTHFDIHNKKLSLLDFIIVSEVSRVVYKGQFWVHGFRSNHALIFLSYNIETNHEDKSFFCRNFNSIDEEGLLRDAGLADLSDMYRTNDVNNQLQFLDHILTSLLNKYVPLKKVQKTTCSKILTSPKLKRMRALRDIEYKAYINGVPGTTYKSYCRLRNKCTAISRKLNHQHGSRLFNNDTTQKQMWCKIRNIGAMSDPGQEINEDLDSLNAHFTKIPPNNLPSTNPPKESKNASSFKNIDLEELNRAFGRIRSNSVGIDGIPIKFLKLLLPVFGTHFLYFLNTIITTSVFPSNWKLSRVTPIPKIKDPKELSNYRPITILAAFSKVLEQILKQQILGFPQVQSNIASYQSGFRQFHSTTTAVLDMTETIRRNLDKKYVSILLALDFSKAFDTIDHNLLCNKLMGGFDFSSSACRLIKSYLSDRRQCVMYDGKSSNFLPVSRGVPQGSILGPIFFSLFINDLPTILSPSLSTTYMYADDVQLLFSTPISYTNLCILEINTEITKVLKWAESNGLVLNTSKTQAICFSKSPIQTTNQIKMCGTIIPFSDSLKILGFTLDNQLSLTKHINTITSKVIFTLRRLYSIQRFLPQFVKIKLTHALVMPFFNYGPEIFFGTSRSNNNRIKVLFNSVLRFTFGLGRRQRGMASFARKLLNTTINRSLISKSVILLYKVKMRKSPRYLFNRLNFTASLRHQGNLIVPSHSTKTMSKSFVMRVWKVWNKLDAEIKNSKSLQDFKTKLIKFLNELSDEAINEIE